jgi:hypothetical protein
MAALAAAKKFTFFIQKKFEGIRIIKICNIIASSSGGDNRDVAHSIVANRQTFLFCSSSYTINSNFEKKNLQNLPTCEKKNFS